MKKVFRSADRRLAGAAVVSGLLLAPLGIFGSSALAHTASGLGPSAAQYQYKVTICHRTHSKKHPFQQIRISNRAVKAHLKHGDTFPPCPTTLQATKKHGKSSEQHGNKPSTSTQNNSSPKSHGQDDNHGNDDHGNNGHHGK
jgi:hypothetical protein